MFADPNSQPLSPEDELKRKIGLLSMASAAPPAMPAGGLAASIPKYQPPPTPGPIATPSSVTPVVPQQRQTDTAELNRLKNTGAGVEQLQHKHPIIGTIARIGDAALSSMFPTIAQNIPGTELHHSMLVNREQGRVNQDLEGEAKEAQTANEQAEPALKAAQTHEAEARANALEDPQAKVGTTPEAQAFSSLLTQVNPDTQKPYTPIEAFEKVKQTAQDVKPDKTVAPHITYDNGIPVSVTDAQSRVYDVNDPKLPPELKPLVDAATRAHKQHESEADTRQARTFAQQEKMFEARQNALTTTTKDMVLAAPKVLLLADRVNKLIDQQAQQLGPAAGRWSEFMAGKVGAPNPQFTQLRTDVGLLQTLLMRMHVGSRGGEYIMKHFQDLIDTGKQSPENLKAALGEIITYAHDVQAEGAQHGMGGNESGGQEVEYVRGTDGKLHQK